MAAPTVTCRVVQLQRLLGKLRLSRGSAAACQLQQVRYKQRGNTKAPPPDTVREKWHVKKEKYKPKVYAKNWAEKVGSREVLDDVWARRYYGRQHHLVTHAISMHRELAQPSMMDNGNGLVHLDCLLDFTTRKKTKFMSGIKNTIILPHAFNDGSENRVIAFCKSQEEREAAMEAGATFAGGADIMKAIENGEIRSDDYDHVVCTTEIVVELARIRKPLLDLFPHKNKGNIGEDIEALVAHFVQGRTYESKKLDDAIGSIRLTIGRLDMALEHLDANFHKYVEAVCSQRSADLGAFIQEGLMVCPPSTERFYIKPEQLTPAVKQSTKGAASTLAEQEEDDDDDDDDDDTEQHAKSN